MKLYKNVNFTQISVYFYLIIFIFLFCYTFYRSEFVYGGNQFLYYYKYYLIFTVSIFFWIMVLFLRKKLKSKIVILSTCIIFLLYFYETIRFYVPAILRLNFNEPQFNEKTKRDIIQELKADKDEDVVPSVFPKLLLERKFVKKKSDIFPLGGVSNTITVFCKEGEEFSIYKSDRYGFNNPDFEWNNKEVFWYLIGDSFTQGSCVLPGEDFASQIRMLTKKSAISLGMSGNGPLIELASLKEYGLQKKPQIVLWFYFERNDLEDLRNEKSNSIFKEYLKENYTQNLISKQIEIDKKLKTFINQVEKELTTNEPTTTKNLEKFSSFKKIIRLQIVRDKLALDRDLIFDVDPLFKEIMLEARDFVNKWDGKLYFVYLPDKERYSNKNIKGDSYLKRSQVIELINSLNIPIIDVHKDFFMNEIDPLSFFAHRIYGHYSPDGYHSISKMIIKQINEIDLNK